MTSLKDALRSLNGLREIEDLIRSKFSSDAPLLSEISSYLFDLGGKRIRPVLCILSAQSLGMTHPSPQLIDVAAGIELIHMATLFHDDIIDRSPLRRHEESPFVRYGLGDTLLTGDFLLTRAFSLCARLDRFIIDATETACVELTEGEILETSLASQSHSIESSLSIARKKTASLFRLACESAAHLASGRPTVVSEFSAFGESLGIAFQILDDILDVVSTEEVLGKRAGIDIREKKPSMVNVLWLQSGSPLAARLLTTAADASDADIELAISELRQSRVIEEARDTARTHATRAMESLERGVPQDLSKSPAAETLRALVRYVLERME